jgi:uncharacterized membrane protein SpoIIM required for sporulation
MTLERFIAQRAESWSELQSLVDQARGRVDRLDPEQIRRLGLLYRRAAADLSKARRNYPDSPGTRQLDDLVKKGHALVYGKQQRDERMTFFFTTGFWRSVREGGRCLGLSIGLLAGSVVLGFVWAAIDPATAAGILPAGFHATTHPGQHGVVGIAIPARTGLAFEIFTNNIKVSILAMAGGFTFGILTSYVMAFNGLLLGVLAELEWKVGAWQAFTRLIVPHGLLELSCIAVAGSAGFQITRVLIDPGRLRRPAALQVIAPRLGYTILGVAACLVVAGLTEGIVTTFDLPIALALTVGLFWAGSFWGLVAWRGRPAHDISIGPDSADSDENTAGSQTRARLLSVR